MSAKAEKVGIVNMDAIKDAIAILESDGDEHGVAAKLRAALAQNAQGEAPVDKRATGVYHKYNVTRTDGSDQLGGKHHDCEYFVLDLTHDPFAKPAAAAYANTCEAEYPMLAADMRNRYGLSAERARVPAVVREVMDELEKALRKFPTWPTDPLHAVGVFNEEAGELSKAVLQQVYEPHKNKPEDVRKEAQQAAAMALRFLVSLDTYEWSPSAQHDQPAFAEGAKA